MDISLLESPYIPDVGTVAALSQPLAQKNAKQFNAQLADRLCSGDTPKAITADNMATDAKGKPIEKAPQGPDNTFQRKIVPRANQSYRDRTQHRTKTPASKTISAAKKRQFASPPQGLLAASTVLDKAAKKGQFTSPQGSLAVSTVFDKAAKKGQFTSPQGSLAVSTVFDKAAKIRIGSSGQQQAKVKTSDKPSQRATSSKVRQLSTVFTRAAKKNIAKPGQTPVTTIKPIAPLPGKKSIQSAISQGEQDTKVVLPDGRRATFPANIGLEKGEKADKKLVITRQPTKQEAGQELTSQSVTIGSKTNSTGGKWVTASDSSVSSTKNKPISKASLPTVEDKPSNSPEKPLNLPEKPPNSLRSTPPIANKPIAKKADTTGQGQVLSESYTGHSKEQAGNASSESVLRSLDQQHLHTSTNQTKGYENLSSGNNSSKSDLDQIFPASDGQSPVAEQTSASVPVGKATNNASTASASISEQIRESIQSSLSQGTQKVTIRLYPPELGKVVIRFHEQENQITGLLEVSKVQTRHEIEQALPEIIRNLAEAGVQVSRIEVVLSEQSEQRTSNDQSLLPGQESHTDQRGSTDHGTQWSDPDRFGDPQTPFTALGGDSSGTYEWSTNDSTYQDNPELREALIANNGINILV